MPHALTIRSLDGVAELSRARRVFQTALVGIEFPATPDPVPFHEAGRLLGALDGGEIVATAEAFSSWMAVPGGTRLPHAAITGVGVLPTHTRRGILTALMRQLLEDAAARGEVVASLRASEATIYGRFGFGVATRLTKYEIVRGQARLRDGVGVGDPVVLREALEHVELMRETAGRANHAGAIGRYDALWRYRQIRWEARKGLLYLAVAGDPAQPSGYALYRPDGEPSSHGTNVVLEDLVVLSDAAWLGLLRFLIGLDLTERIIVRGPADRPLRELMQDDRAVQLVGDDDETWLRPVDVERALAARSYGEGGADEDAVVLEIEDQLLPDNAGCYRVSAAGSGRTEAAPDLSLDVATLGAAYLGGTRWRDLALAGRVSERRPGAVAAADRLFRTDRAPFSGASF